MSCGLKPAIMTSVLMVTATAVAGPVSVRDQGPVEPARAVRPVGGDKPSADGTPVPVTTSSSSAMLASPSAVQPDLFGATRISRGVSGLDGRDAYVELMTALVDSDRVAPHVAGSMVPGVHTSDPLVVVPLPPTVLAGLATLGGAMIVTAWRRRRVQHRAA